MLNKIDELKIRKILKKENIEYIDSDIDYAFSETTLRTKESIAKKAIATLITIQLACDYEKGNEQFEKSKKFMLNLLDRYDVKDYLSTRESSIFNNDIEPIEAKIMINSYEAVNVLFWSLGIVKKLNSPLYECDFDYLIKALASCESYAPFDKHTKLLGQKNIYFYYDLTFRYNLFLEKSNTSRIERKILTERLKAFRWLLSLEEKWL